MADDIKAMRDTAKQLIDEFCKTLQEIEIKE
jgi:hypothetical protein